MSAIDSTVDSFVDSASNFARAHKTMMQVILLVLSAFGFSLMFNPLTGFLLTLVIFVHELGHYIPSRYYGVGTGMYMVPLLGGVTLSDSKRYERLTAYQQFVIVYSGPATGLIFTVVGLAGWYMTGATIWLIAAYVSSVLNFTNLLPLGMLDGRKILDLFSSSGSRARLVAICCLNAISLLLATVGTMYGFVTIFGVLYYLIAGHKPDMVRAPMSDQQLKIPYVMYTVMALGLGLPLAMVQMIDHASRSLVVSSFQLTTFGWIMMAVSLLVMIAMPLVRRSSK